MVDVSKNITFQWESIASTREEFMPLYKDHMGIIFGTDDINLDNLIIMEESGIVAQCTARYNGKPAGYYVVMLTPSIYNPSIIEARDVGIYTAPDYRDMGISSVLTDMVEEECRKAGAKSITTSYPYEATLPKKKGYKLIEYIYERKL